MNLYHIRIDNKYFAGVNDEVIAKAPSGGWYDVGKNVNALFLVSEIEYAKEIGGNTNLKSYFNKIHDAIRYGGLSFHEITIIKIGEE